MFTSLRFQGDRRTAVASIDHLSVGGELDTGVGNLYKYFNLLSMGRAPLFDRANA
jgi:hypothetical protein